jgi:hypothetical protein
MNWVPFDPVLKENCPVPFRIGPFPVPSGSERYVSASIDRPSGNPSPSGF